MESKQAETVVLTKGHRTNFDMMSTAANAGDLGLVSSRRVADGQDVALVCAIQIDEDGSIMLIPFAEMINGDPFEIYQDPTWMEHDDSTRDTPSGA